MRLESEASY